MNRPLCFLIGVFIAGIIYNNHGLAIIAGPLLFVAYYYSYLRKYKNTHLLKHILIIISFSAFFILGIIVSKKQNKESTIKTHMQNNDRIVSAIEGTVEDIYDSPKGKKILINVKSVDDKPIARHKECMYIYTQEDYEIGQLLSFKNQIYFYQKPLNRGEFNLYAYQKTRHVVAYAYPDEISVKESKNSLKTIKYTLKKYIVSARRKYIEVVNQIFDEKSAGTIILMVTGCNQYMDEDLKETYQNTGFAHILSISGLHISIIGLGIFGFLRKRKLTYTSSTIFTLAFLTVYDVFSGGHVTCERAIFAMLFALTARTLAKKNDPYTGLMFAAFVVLLNQPLYVYDISFLLSFSAGFAIACLQGPINKLVINIKIKYLGGLISKIIKSFLFTFGLNIFLMPVQMLFFYTINPYSFIANILLLPLMPVVLVGGIVLPIAYNWFYGVDKLTFIVENILDLFEFVCKILNRLYNAQMVTGVLTPIKFCIWLICIIGFMSLIAGKRRVNISCFVPLVVSLIIVIPVKKDQLGVSFLYVGQGDCCVIMTEDGVALIDCGSSDRERLYKNVIKPFINYNGYSKIDYIFASHGDKDHISGIVEAAKEGKTKETYLFLPSLLDYTKMDSAFEYTSNDKYFKKVEHLIASDKVELLGLKINVLNPTKSYNNETENDTSMVLSVAYKGLNILFMGDLGMDYEKDVIEQAMDHGIVRADIIKVGHHGSRFSTSTELLDYFKPSKAVLSCGIDNMYNHPSLDVLDKLAEKKIEMHITKEEGEYYFIYKN